MSRAFLTSIDLAQNELQNGVVQNLAAAPAAPAPKKGQMYFNTGDNTLYWFDGTAWVAAKAGAGTPTGPAGGDLTGTYPNPTIGASKVTSAHIADGTIVVGDTATAFTLNAISSAHATAADIVMNGWRVAGVGDPLTAMDAANKQYVDAVAQGLDWKASVRVATTGPITLATIGLGTAIDTVTLVDGDRVLVKNQTTGSENGIYIAHTTPWTRATDMDTSAETSPGSSTWVEEGLAFADTGWVLSTNAPIVLGTTSLTFTQFSGAGTFNAGLGLTKTGNTFDVGAGQGIIGTADSLDLNFTAISPPDTGSALTVARGDHAHSLLYPPLARSISTTAPLTGGGDLSANRTLAITAFAGSTPGAVPTSPGGTAVFLRADGTWAAPAGGGTLNKTAVLVGGATSQVVAHTQGQDCTVAVYRNSSPWDEVECDVEHTSATSVTLRFAVAPAANAYRCVVTG